MARMLGKNVGYNVSPEFWFNKFDTIGVLDTYVTDYRAIGEILGPVRANTKFEIGLFSRGNKLSYFKVRQLEKALGLDPRTLTDGFRLSRVTSLFERSVRSPLGGNDFFTEPGAGLPGGGPELAIDPVSTDPWPPRRIEP